MKNIINKTFKAIDRVNSILILGVYGYSLVKWVKINKQLRDLDENNDTISD